MQSNSALSRWSRGADPTSQKAASSLSSVPAGASTRVSLTLVLSTALGQQA